MSRFHGTSPRGSPTVRALRPGSSEGVDPAHRRNGLAGRLLLLGWFSVRVPCCRGCGYWIQLDRVGGVVRTVVIGLGTCALAGASVHYAFGLDGTVLGLLAFSITVLSTAALVLWEQTHPPVFTVDVHRTTVEYEFRSRDQALEFAALNCVTPEPWSEPIWQGPGLRNRA